MYVALALQATDYNLSSSIKRFLKQQGHDLIELPPNMQIGPSFFQAKSGNQPDVMVLDADIPVIKTFEQAASGAPSDIKIVDLPPLEFLKTMRGAGVDIPVLIISDRDLRLQANNAQADRFLSKSAGTDTILRFIYDLLLDSASEFDPVPGLDSDLSL